MVMTKRMKLGPLKILLVDDHQDFMDTLTYYLDKFPPVRVIAKARSGEEALKWIQTKKPDLVLVDLMMDTMNGIETTRRIKALVPSPRVVILTVFNDAEYHAEAEKAGADGFLGKSEITAKLFPLIHRLFPGRELP